MEMNEYQEQARTTRLPDADWEYLLLNLSGEVGELLSIEAKARRDGIVPNDYFIRVEKELGDILWHVALIAYDHGVTLTEVAEANLKKLADRQARNVLGGSGDNR